MSTNFVQMEHFVNVWKELPTEFKDNILLSSERESILRRLELEGLSFGGKTLRDEPAGAKGI
jgi:hypothetical protein